MELFDKFRISLTRCRSILNRGYTNTRNSGISWLNNFCAEFLGFTNYLQTFLSSLLNDEAKQSEEIIFLCLSQIVICIRHMERTIKAEDVSRMAISASRQHFLDRIHWCLERLRVTLRGMAMQTETKHVTEDQSFVELMDLALDHLAPYSSYMEAEVLNVAQRNADAMFASKQLRSTVDQILSHTLAFANVALQDDKRALSALCQKVLRECIAFQEECERDRKCNDCNRKLKAMSIENALYQLEDYINEALLRLVYHTFRDHHNFSIEKLRNAMRVYKADDTALDELIADFDVNIDRTTQIGIFAIAFAPTVKIKTIVRSCLASLESLDTCIIPALQARTSNDDVHVELLEEHFNEEVTKFKCAIQEIIDSHAFTVCYYEMVTQTLTMQEKSYDKVQLQELVQMGEFLYEHFQIKVNYQELQQADNSQRMHLYEKLILILRECQAILMCADQVAPQRILKRFKILRSILRKFTDALSDIGTQSQNKRECSLIATNDDLSDSQHMFASIGISPSIPSILYNNDELSSMHRRRAASDSLKANSSKMKQIPLQATQQQRSKAAAAASVTQPSPLTAIEAKPRNSIRRKESLRTSMFKRRKAIESRNVYESYRSNSSTSLQITDILDQLTGFSSKFSESKKMAEE